MKQTIAFAGALALLAACQPAAHHGEAEMAMKAKDSVQKVFETNCAAIRSMLQGFQGENIDHAAFYSDTLRVLQTGFNSPQDTIGLDTLMAHHQWMWSTFDFALADDSLDLLPGVNPDTKEMDGSVRFYSSWRVTKTATDSTPEKSGVIKLYESFDFNADGKVVYQQIYGDFGSLMGYLMSN
jgi:hypothetical protein